MSGKPRFESVATTGVCEQESWQSRAISQYRNVDYLELWFRERWIGSIKSDILLLVSRAVVLSLSWFTTLGVEELVALSRGTFGCHYWTLLLASSRWRPEMPLNILPWKTQLPTTTKDPAQDVSSAEAETPAPEVGSGGHTSHALLQSSFWIFILYVHFNHFRLIFYYESPGVLLG